MLEFSDKPVLQAKPFQKRLLWIGASVIAILLFTIIFRLMRARAGKMLQPPQQANEVLAVITNSGSTNAPGSTLTIMQNGSGSLTYQKGAQEERFGHYVNRTFPSATFESKQLENMLTQIKDVGTIPNRDCLKSVSFGSTTTITYQGKTSGDLSCLSNEDPKIFLDLKKLVQSMLTHV